ncbi:hypothetical protein [Dyella flagellata]|uniref:Uncharacterized protein n=1 Tax=Dyella flagellata TaxID=1867833 RepID=A0ABQ5XDG3_9GAMM|nr:hypothetical protein [Dyella flagellata]GLQ89012.1 hypothetical protein GCM10007898_25840 [Dyella flagellata]
MEVPHAIDTPARPAVADALDRLKLFLDYLKVEMTIMGLLSAFCVAALGVAAKVATNEPQAQWFQALWYTSYYYVLAAAALVFLAALLFYLQRSELAWHYGQLTLSIQDVDIGVDSTKDLLFSADSWATWARYHYAFAALVAAGIELGIAVGVLTSSIARSGAVTTVFVALPPLLAAGATIVWRTILKKQDNNQTEAREAAKV